MKPFISFPIALIFWLMLPTSVIGKCDTLLLKDRQPLLVEVERLSMEVIQYRPCGAARDKTKQVGWNQVEDYRPGNPAALSMQTLPSVNSKTAKELRNKWVFKHKTRRKAFIIHEGDRITVEHHEMGFRRKSQGFLHTIDDHSLYVKNEYGYIIPVPRDNVLKIKRNRKGSGAGKALGAFSIAMGVLIAIGVILASLMIAVVSIAMFVVAPFSANEGPKEPGCTIPILILLGGVGIFMLSQPKSINTPFGHMWEVTLEEPTGSPQDATLPDGLGAP